MSYKIINAQKIIDYIASSYGVVLVDDTIQNSGADKLRVYSALFELEQNGFPEVVEREELGVPLVIHRRRDASQVQYDIM